MTMWSWCFRRYLNYKKNKNLFSEYLEKSNDCSWNCRAMGFDLLDTPGILHSSWVPISTKVQKMVERAGGKATENQLEWLSYRMAGRTKYSAQ
jgi:hypothetical protein